MSRGGFSRGGEIKEEKQEEGWRWELAAGRTFSQLTAGHDGGHGPQGLHEGGVHHQVPTGVGEVLGTHTHTHTHTRGDTPGQSDQQEGD